MKKKEKMPKSNLKKENKDPQPKKPQETQEPPRQKQPQEPQPLSAQEQFQVQEISSSNTKTPLISEEDLAKLANIAKISEPDSGPIAQPLSESDTDLKNKVATLEKNIEGIHNALYLLGDQIQKILDTINKFISPQQVTPPAFATQYQVEQPHGAQPQAQIKQPNNLALLIQGLAELNKIGQMATQVQHRGDGHPQTELETQLGTLNIIGQAFKNIFGTAGDLRKQAIAEMAETFKIMRQMIGSSQPPAPSSREETEMGHVKQ